MIYNNHCLGIKKTTVEYILHHAVEDFNTRLAKNKWSVKDGKRKQSAFFSGNCHKSGKPGHMKKDCRVRSTGNNNASSNNRAGQGRSNGNNQGNGAVVSTIVALLVPLLAAFSRSIIHLLSGAIVAISAIALIVTIRSSLASLIVT